MRSAQIFRDIFLTENHPGNLKCYPRPAQNSRFQSQTGPNQIATFSEIFENCQLKTLLNSKILQIVF